MEKKGSPLKKRLYTLILVCIVPLVLFVLYLLYMINSFSERYDAIVENITTANEFNVEFKEDLDYLMYIIAVNAERAELVADTKKPYEMIEAAREAFEDLHDSATEATPRGQTKRILIGLDTLEDRVKEIEKDALVSGNYDINMERLDVNIRALTGLIQSEIQEYIYYEATNLEALREDIRKDVDQAIQIIGIMFIVVMGFALFISQGIISGITKPIRKLCEVTKGVGSGDFAIRAVEGNDDELAILNTSFNQMVERIGKLVEDIRIEQLNLKETELKLLQAQINPHFLYNTLDAIMWLAEAGEKEQVVSMVSSLSDFFRTTLSKGRDFVTLKEEEIHIQSYLQIQQFRYQDILEYEIDIPEELHGHEILKMTLQPLVENALYHGLKNKRRLGHICVTGRGENENLVLCVRDDGMGIKPERLTYIQKMLKGEETDYENPSGFGLFNVQQRIRLNYGVQYGMTINSVYGEWTEVKIVIPAVKNETFS